MNTGKFNKTEFEEVAEKSVEKYSKLTKRPPFLFKFLYKP